MKIPWCCVNLHLPDGDSIPTGHERCWHRRIHHVMHEQGLFPEEWITGPRGGKHLNPEYYKTRPPRELLATVDFQVVLNFYGLGSKGRQSLVDYLAEGGLKFKGQPDVWPAAKGSRENKPVSKKRIDEAKRLLERCGFTVNR